MRCPRGAGGRLQERALAYATQLAAGAPAELRPVHEESAAYAHRSRDTIARFGRFPHRNTVLARESTAEERAFLKDWPGG